MIPLSPQLIGQTEKALNALLRTVLVGHDLSEHEWVTLKLTSQFDGAGELDAFVTDRLPDSDAGAHLAALRRRGLLVGSALSPAGAAVVAAVGQEIARLTGPVWDAVPTHEVDAAARALNTILDETRALLRRR